MLWAGNSLYPGIAGQVLSGGYYFPLDRFNIDHIGASTQNGSVQVRVKIEFDFTFVPGAVGVATKT